MRAFWVVLSMERELAWETPLYSLGPLSSLEERLPLPQECMVQASAAADTSHLETFHTVIDACYPLFLAETCLRQIYWRVSGAPELQEDYAFDKEMQFHPPHSSPPSPTATPVLPVVKELSSQVSEWLESVPASAHWSLNAEAGAASPLSTRIKIQYWLCRFGIHKSALYHLLESGAPLASADVVAQVRAQAALEAASRCLYIFYEESFVADEVLGHRYCFIFYFFFFLMVLRLVLGLSDRQQDSHAARRLLRRRHGPRTGRSENGKSGPAHRDGYLGGTMCTATGCADQPHDWRSRRATTEEPLVIGGPGRIPRRHWHVPETTRLGSPEGVNQ